MITTAPTIAAAATAGAVSVTVGRATKQGNGQVISTYEAASTTSQELAGWWPVLKAADGEVLPARDRIVARSRYLARNNGWAAGGIEKRVDAVVGANIWLRLRPDFVALGQTAEWADEWATTTESLFRLWANSPRFLCDVERHHQFGGLVHLAYTHYVADGEACAPLYWLPERGGMFATSVLVLDPDRLCNPDGRADSRTLRGGVQIDPATGAATGYWVRDAHQNDVGTPFESQRWAFIPRETNTGRPLFVHAFNKNRAHMHRGIGRLASVMARMKMLDRYDQAEIQQAVMGAIFGLYAKTTRSSDDVRQSLAPAGDDDDIEFDSLRANFYEQSDIKLAGVRLAVLPDGDEIDTVESKRTGGNFKAFQRVILNSVASALGLSGEQLSNDWEGINYSSARTLLNEIWRGLNTDRHLFTQSFCTPIFSAWLEEAVARDLVQIPGGKAGFYLFRDALCQCDWIGPGRGYIDPMKEQQAASGRIGSFISNLPDEAAEQGNDWRLNLWNAKRVLEERKRYGLEPVAAEPQGNAGGDPNAQDSADKTESDQARRAE